MSGQSPWDLTLARHLVCRAAHKAPPDLAERLREEWLADLMVRRGPFSRIGFGLGCCWATRVIAREFSVAAAAAGTSASGERVLAGCGGGRGLSGFSRRTTAIIVIVGLHLGIFYLYLNGFTRALIVSATDPLAGHFIVQPVTRVPPRQLPPPTITPTTINELPLPDPKILTVATAVITTPPSRPVRPVQTAPPVPVERMIGGPGAGFPNTQDYYPPGPRRLDEEGTSAVRVCVDPTGRLTAAPALVSSSGNGQLDEGALRLASAGSGHYRATTENGRPVSSCYSFRIRFQLEDQ